jgi:membrane protein
LRASLGWLARSASETTHVLRFALRRFIEERAPESAASMAFYAIFSLFPLLLLLVLAGRLFIAGYGHEDDVLRLVLTAFPPTFADLIERNVNVALAAQGALAGAAGLVGLVWSAASGFSILAVTLNRAWKGARPIGAVVARLRALTIVGCLVGLLALLLVSRAALRLLSLLGAALGRPPWMDTLGQLHPGFTIAVLVFVTLFLLYRLVPRRKVHWLPAVAGALFASAASLAATWAFTLFLSRGLAAYQLVYGPLGALIAFLTWVYAIAIIVQFGAYLGAALAEHRGVHGPARTG